MDEPEQWLKSTMCLLLVCLLFFYCCFVVVVWTIIQNLKPKFSFFCLKQVLPQTIVSGSGVLMAFFELRPPPLAQFHQRHPHWQATGLVPSDSITACCVLSWKASQNLFGASLWYAWFALWSMQSLCHWPTPPPRWLAGFFFLQSGRMEMTPLYPGSGQIVWSGP